MPTYFPYELDRITLTKRTADTRVDILLDGDNIFSATLTPNDKEQIVLTDMGRYLSDRVEQARKASQYPNAFLKQTLEVWCDDTTMTEYALRPCRSRMRDKAANLLPSMFLTMASGGTKLLPATADSEPLYLLSDNDTGAYDYTIGYYWINTQTRQCQRTTERGSATAKPGQVVRIDVSPATAPAPDRSGQWQLLRIEVTSSARHMTYQIAPDGLTQVDADSLQFVNSFGLIETFYLLGQIEQEVKPTYSAALIEGNQVNYLVDSNPTYKAATGPLTDATIALLRDLATSTEVTHGGRAVTITAIDLKPTNAYADQQKATITWRESVEGGTAEPTTPHGTFDKTFEATFDRTT